MFAGRLFDGVDASDHAVEVTVGGDAIELSQSGGWRAHIPTAELVALDSPPSELRLGRRDRAGWRLILPREAEPAIAPLLGRREQYGRWIDRIGLGPAVVAGGLVTAAVLGIGYTAPRLLAPHVPAAWERNLGASLFGDFGANRCRSAEGDKALRAIVERVAPGATAGPNGLRIAALDVPMFNAAALPGGYIVIFRPMLETVEADALAGIVAHEIAHVRRRHVTEALLRELGIGALVRLFAGDLGANAQQLVALSYTRDNEREADADAVAMLKRANISPMPTAKLFRDLAPKEGKGARLSAEFLESHPLTVRRAGAFAASAVRGRRYRPALSPRQERALQQACRGAANDVKRT